MQGKNEMRNRRVLLLAADGVEHDEIVEPRDAFAAAGADVTIASPGGHGVQAMQGIDRTDHIATTSGLADLHESDFDALVLPGGALGVDALRVNEDAVRLVREFMEADKPVAAIGHAVWLLIEADAVRGRTLTSAPSLRTEVTNAGGSWVDKQVQVDQRLVTSRGPADVRAFCQRVLHDAGSAIAERALDLLVEQTFPASDPLPPPTTIGASPPERRRPGGRGDAHAR
jgi:deglycase